LDPFGYSINGVEFQLTNDGGADIQNGTITIPVEAGDEFCFYINATDNVLGAAVTLAMDFGYVGSSLPDLEQLAGLPSGSQFPLGTTINTYLVTDDSSNTAECSFSITVVDTEAPVIDCPAGVELEMDADACVASFTPELTDLIVSDNCTVFEDLA